MRLFTFLYFFIEILSLLRSLSVGYLCCSVKFCYYAGQTIRKIGVLHLTCPLLKCLKYKPWKSGNLIFRFT